MALDGRPGHQLALPEDGLIGGHVVVLIAHGEDVVVEDDVALVDVVAEVLDDVLADRLQGEGQDGQILLLLEHVAGGVVEPGHEVTRLAEDGRPGGARHRDGHLLRDALQALLEDRDQDAVDGDATPGGRRTWDARR